MAVDRQRLAAALAYRQAEEERRRRMMESVPTVGNLPPTQPARRSLRTDLENLSAGIGQGVVNQLEGVKALVTDPVGTARAAYEGVRGVVRDPSVIADALRYTADKAMSGPLGAGEVIGEMVNPMRIRGKSPMAEIDVYHGSPHRFEEFDASKIGTGEGAQAYGHGIYLAENPDVAKGYQKQLAQIKPEMTVEFGLPISGKSKKFAETALQSSSGDVDSAIKNLKENLQFYSSVEAKNAASEAINALKTAKITWGKDYPIGHFYTADLPDEMVDRMLDWDKPLIEQRPILKALTEMANRDRTGASAVAARTARSILQRAGQAADSYGKDKVTGASLYDSFLADEIPDQAQRSQFLKDLGIPGIRYRDAGSRGQSGTGTRNFVVFPGEEKKVKILRRE